MAERSKALQLSCGLAGCGFESRWRHIFSFWIFSLPPRSEQVNGAVANEIKHVHSPEVIVVLDPRYDLSYKALYISTCSIALSHIDVQTDWRRLLTYAQTPTRKQHRHLTSLGSFTLYFDRQMKLKLPPDTSKFLFVVTRYTWIYVCCDHQINYGACHLQASVNIPCKTILTR